MARAGRGQPINVLITNALFDQPVQGPTTPTVFGDIADTLAGVTAVATQASTATGILNEILDILVTGSRGSGDTTNSGALGATNHSELAETLDDLTLSARGANANVIITPGPRGGRGHGTGLHGAQHRHGIMLLNKVGVASTPPSQQESTTATSYILLESGEQLLDETGDPLVLEANNDL